MKADVLRYAVALQTPRTDEDVVRQALLAVPDGAGGSEEDHPRHRLASWCLRGEELPRSGSAVSALAEVVRAIRAVRVQAFGHQSASRYRVSSVA